jgi:hypothetical protein
MRTPKYCIDCKYAKHVDNGIDYLRCANPGSYKPGSTLVAPGLADAYASIERNNGNCGVDGKNFEPKDAPPGAVVILREPPQPTRGFWKRLFC